MSDERTYDVVLFGATGFTGGLTAEYLARHAPPATRWAIAGRDMAKLEAVRERLGADFKDLDLLYADVTAPDTLDAVAAAARVVITTVGPYIDYGEPLVAACAEHGTDYLDLTGEPEFTDLMYVRHHARAQATGARLVHAAGFESIPPDLGVYFTVSHLPADVPLRVEGFLRANARFSGGTAQSAVTAMARSRQTIRAALDRRRAEPPLTGRRIRIAKGPSHFAPPRGAVPLPMPFIDPLIVTRSARLLDRYGPDFTYGHYLATPNLLAAAGTVAGAGTLFTLAQVRPVRSLLLRLTPPGKGPTPEQRARSWFNLRFVGEGGGHRVVTEVSGGDPGYDETAMMIAEAALCLAHDTLPESSGQVTPAAAMGDALIARLRRAGLTFRVLKET